MRLYRASLFVMVAASAHVVHAQSGWEARLTMAPNPLPGGRCGGIVAEIVDDHGYRRSTLSNGAPIDPRSYQFAISDPSHVTIQNDASVTVRVCADTSVKASKTMVTVTFPDGLVGTLEIALVPKGTVGQRAVVYRAQAPLRVATSPEFAPGFVPGVSTSGGAAGGGAGHGGGGSAASGGAAGGASAGGGAAGSAAGDAAGAGAHGGEAQGAIALVITKPLSLTGARSAAMPSKSKTP